MEFDFGDTIKGRYWLGKPLGNEELANSWLARDEMNGSEVVVDVLSEKLHKQTISEYATKLSLINHSSIPRIIDLGERDDRACLIVEYINGPNLEKVIKAGQAKEQAHRYFTQALEGLAQMHTVELLLGQITAKDLVLDLGLNQIKLTGFFNIETARYSSKDDLLHLAKIFYPLLGSEVTRSGETCRGMMDGEFETALTALSHLNSNPTSSSQVAFSNPDLFQENPVKEYDSRDLNLPKFNLGKIIAMIATTLCVLTVAGYLVIQQRTDEEVARPRGSEVYVPSFVGLDLSQAQLLAQQTELVIVINNVDTQSDDPDNTVTQQTPVAGELVPEDEPINVTISGK